MTNRITQLSKEQASEASKELLVKIEQKFGRVPNIFKVMANSPALLEGFLGLSGGLQNIKLDSRINEKIAIMIAVENGCEYCLTAHSYALSKMGESEEEILNARKRFSSDAKTLAALEFAYSVFKNAGNVSDEELENIKAEGLSEEEILEIIGIITVNVFTTAVNNLAKTVIDFPKLKEPIGSLEA